MAYDVKTFEAGELILKEGDVGKGFFILEDGVLQVVEVVRYSMKLDPEVPCLAN